MAKMKGLRSLNMKLGRLGPAAVQTAHRALRDGAQSIVDTAVAGIIDPPKTGKKYKSRYRKGHVHQASAPGEYPAADQPELHTKITSVDASTEQTLRFEVGLPTGKHVPHGTYLELGTSKMAPRPWLVPSYKKNVDTIRANVRAAVKRGVREGSR